MRQIEREQAEALKAKLPDFWLPSLTPTYTTTGPPTSLQDVKVQTTCRGGNPSHHLAYALCLPLLSDRADSDTARRLKNLIPVTFDLLPAESKREEDARAICLSCKKELTNNMRLFRTQSVQPS